MKEALRMDQESCVSSGTKRIVSRHNKGDVWGVSSHRVEYLGIRLRKEDDKIEHHVQNKHKPGIVVLSAHKERQPCQENPSEKHQASARSSEQATSQLTNGRFF
jgi:hypothetical protein